MAGTTTDTKSLIEEQYANLVKAQKEKIDAEYDISRNQYNHQLGKAEETYQPLRNEAYVNNALAEKARKENMANMGLSGEGGTSLSLQQRNNGNLLSTLGDVSRQEEGYKDEVGLALANLDTTYYGNINSVTADAEAQRIAALLSQGQFDANYALNADQLKLSKGGALADQVLQLYNNKLITKKQLNQYLDYSKTTGFEGFLNEYYSN
jgi:hypothetical protein